MAQQLVSLYPLRKITGAILNVKNASGRKCDFEDPPFAMRAQSSRPIAREVGSSRDGDQCACSYWICA